MPGLLSTRPTHPLFFAFRKRGLFDIQLISKTDVCSILRLLYIITEHGTENERETREQEPAFSKL